MRHVAINRTCLRFASLRLAQVRARLAVMTGSSQNDTIARAETSVARTRAWGPFVELADDAVYVAWQNTASSVLFQGGTLIASGTMLDDFTSSCALPNTTGLAARTPRTKLGHLAMVGAMPKVALSGFILVSTHGTTVVLDRRNAPGSGLSTVTTSYRAVTERTPVGHFAVYRTGVVVAGTVLQHVRAGLATIHFCLASDMALTTLAAPPAGFGARGPFLEIRDPAVDRTVLSLTLTRVLQRRALFAFEHGFRCDATPAELLSSTTALGAAFPLLPVTHNAVDGAWANVALTNLLQEWANTVGFLVLDGPTAVHVPKLIGGVHGVGTRLIACTPVAPLRNFAIHCAWPSVTLSRIFQCRASLALCNARGYNYSSTVLAAFAAFFVAQVKSAPACDFAVYWAHICVALGRLRKTRAGVATMLFVRDNVPGARLFADIFPFAASSAALTELRPGTYLAV